MKNKEKKTKTE